MIAHAHDASRPRTVRWTVVSTIVTSALLACVPTGGATGACALLSVCCGQAGAANETVCADTLSAGDDAVCGSELTSLEESGACGGDASTGSCAALAACCTGMTSFSASACEHTAGLGNATACSEELTSFESSGACNGGGGDRYGHGHGHAEGHADGHGHGHGHADGHGHGHGHADGHGHGHGELTRSILACLALSLAHAALSQGPCRQSWRDRASRHTHVQAPGHRHRGGLLGGGRRRPARPRRRRGRPPRAGTAQGLVPQHRRRHRGSARDGGRRRAPRLRLPEREARVRGGRGGSGSDLRRAASRTCSTRSATR